MTLDLRTAAAALVERTTEGQHLPPNVTEPATLARLAALFVMRKADPDRDSADSIIVLQRKRLETFGTIRVTGRDIPDAEFSVRFDGMLWSEAPKVLSAASFERLEVYRVIEERGPIFPAAIAELTGLGRTSIQNMVSALADEAVVIRQTGGYVLSPSLARARGTSLPHDSSDYESHQSHRGVKGIPDAPIATVECRDYLAHRDDHVRDSAGVWHCLACEGGAA